MTKITVDATAEGMSIAAKILENIARTLACDLDNEVVLAPVVNDLCSQSEALIAAAKLLRDAVAA